ncbi:MAG TPA: hypothetical protein VD994_03205 [Prosthecobacter sp.]|nr:hypothetical protein [Prosthecobacter sp.]
MTLLMLGWIVCGILGYGVTFAHFQDKWPQLAYRDRREDAGFAAMVAISGPIGLFAALLFSGFAANGLRYRPLSREASAAAHRQAYQHLEVDF